MSAAALDDEQRRYSTVAIVLHWTIALLILTNITIGLKADDQHGMAKFVSLQWHKSIGITVLILSFARLAWRLLHRPPPYPGHMPAWEKAVAKATHWAFYALMLGLPLTGWAMVSASPTNIPTVLYQMVPWPHIGPIHALPLAERKGLTGELLDVHEFLAWSAIVLIVLHVGAALKHQLRDRDQVVWRMAPLGALKPPTLPGKDG
jgi:cytochrome b561